MALNGHKSPTRAARAIQRRLTVNLCDSGRFTPQVALNCPQSPQNDRILTGLQSRPLQV